jgi:hypothetical protein
MGEFVQRQIGDHPAASGGIGVEENLVGPAQDVCHGLKKDALPADIGRLFVFLKNLEKASGLTGRLGDGLLAIGFGGLSDLRGLAARFRDDLVSVGLRLVLRSLGIGFGGLYVVERVDHLGRRIDLE